MKTENQQTEQQRSDSDGVEKETAAFPWLVTPNFFFGFLLLGCLFLPGFQGCSDETVSVGGAVGSVFVGFTGVPQFLAITVLITSSLWCMRWKASHGQISASRSAWLAYTTLAIVVFLLATGLLVFFSLHEEWWNKSSSRYEFTFWSLTILYAVSPLVSWMFVRFKKGSWFYKASLMQFLLSLAAIVSAAYYLPTLALAKKIYIGGKLNIIGVFATLFMSVIQMMDGERSLYRRKGEPVLQLTLKQVFVLVTLACILTAIGAAMFQAELDSFIKTREPQVIPE